jgi:hypothetical protein
MPVTPTRKVMKAELVNRYLKAANSPQQHERP